MTFNTPNGTINNGYYVPNMSTHQNSFANIIPGPCSFYQAPNKHGTPEMPANHDPYKRNAFIEQSFNPMLNLKPVKFEPIKLEFTKIEPVKVEIFKYKF